jgi:hypothetical protein
MPTEDPFAWTVDELVGELCDSRELYKAAGIAIVNVPDLPALEHQLQIRQITGSTLLNFDRSALVVRNELQIPHLGQRMTLMSVVELLRRRSETYQRQAVNACVGLLDVKGEAGRKRAKITHISTAPLPVTSQNVPEAAVTPTQGLFSEQPLAGVGDWDHLLRWQHEGDNDEIIDLDGDDDEPEDDEQYSLAHAAEEDQREVPENEAEEGPTNRSKLSTEQVTEIINERIEAYTNSWFVNKGIARGEELQYDPQKLWTEAETSGRRKDLVQKYEDDHAYYRQRLDRLCLEIVESPGSNIAQVRRQCSNLEVTIDSMELTGWLLDIYKLDPVETSEEETELDNQGTGIPSGESLRSTHRSKLPTQIIDLGTPSESSGDDEENASSFDNMFKTATTTNTIGARPVSLRRSATPDSVIDKTVESDSVILETVEQLEPVAPDQTLPMRTPITHGDEPQNASITTVRRWRWADLLEHLDRKRVVSKAILEMGMDDREVIRNRIEQVGKTNLIKETKACVDMQWKGESRIQGVLPRDLPKIMTFTNLFLSWWFCQNHFTQSSTVSSRGLEELKQYLEDGTAEISTFYDYVFTVMRTTFSPQAMQFPERPSQAEIIEISDDDDDDDD